MIASDNMGNHVSNETVAVLAERVEILIQGHSRMEGLLLGISTAQAVHLQRLNEGDQSRQTLFNRLDTLRRDHDGVASEVKTHSFTWKLVGSFALAALGLVGYAFSELRDLQKGAAQRDQRITVLEYVTGQRAGSPPASRPGEPQK